MKLFSADNHKVKEQREERKIRQAHDVKTTKETRRNTESNKTPKEINTGKLSSK